MKRFLLSRPLLVVAGTIVFFATSSAIALAMWVMPASKVEVSTKAASVPDGPRPSATADGTSVTLSWAPMRGLGDVGYKILRYHADGSGPGVAAGGTCSGTVSHSTCVDQAVPAGEWVYSTHAVIGSWSGDEGAKSVSVTVTVPLATNAETNPSAALAPAAPLAPGGQPGGGDKGSPAMTPTAPSPKSQPLAPTEKPTEKPTEGPTEKPTTNAPTAPTDAGSTSAPSGPTSQGTADPAPAPSDT
jgi:hypothetical protein